MRGWRFAVVHFSARCASDAGAGDKQLRLDAGPIWQLTSCQKQFNMRTGSARKRREADRISKLLEEEYLDTGEQEELLAEFQDLHRNNVRQWRRLWGLLGLLVALMYSVCALYQMLKPWDTRQHAYFQELYRAQTIAAAQLMSGCSLLLLALSMFLGSPDLEGPPQLPAARTTSMSTKLFAAGMAVGAGLALFWAFAIACAVTAESLPMRDIWRLLWLPLGPLLYGLLTRHMLHSFLDTSSEISLLKHKMYCCKKA